MSRFADIAKLFDEAKTGYRNAYTELEKLPSDATDEQRKEAHAKFDAAINDADGIRETAERMQKADKLQSDLEDAASGGADPDDRSGDPRGDANQGKDDDGRFKRAFYEFLSCKGAEDLIAMPRESLELVRGSWSAFSENEIAGLQARARAENRTQVVGTDTKGGYLVPTETSEMIGQRMQFYGSMFEPGLTFELVTDHGNQMEFPRVAASEVTQKGAAKTEIQTTTDRETAFDEMVLNAYTFDSGLIRLSWQLLEDAPQQMELLDTLIANLLGEALGRTGNEQFTKGTGSTAPNGIVTGSAAYSTTAYSKTADPTLDMMKDLIHSVGPCIQDCTAKPEVPVQ